MANKEANYDKVLLILAAIAALATAGTLYYFKTGFAATLEVKPGKPQQDFGVIPLEDAKQAVLHLQQPYEWTAPVIQNKPVPLNKSVTIVLKGNELYDLFVENPPLRPPMTNLFLRSPSKKPELNKELDYLSPNVADLDPDNDGFTNLEEFQAGTDPLDPAAHPPVTKHLYFRSRVQNDYLLVLQTSDTPFQVRRIKPEPAGSVFINSLPQDFGFEKGAGAVMRFTAEKFEKKEVAGKNVSELTVHDKATNERVVLVYRENKNLAEYKVELEFRNKVVTILTPKKGDNFRLPDIAATFKVLDVQENNATIGRMGDNGDVVEKFVVNPRP